MMSYFALLLSGDCCGRHDCMVVGFTTTYAISAFSFITNVFEFESHLWRGVFEIILGDEVCQ